MIRQVFIYFNLVVFTNFDCFSHFYFLVCTYAVTLTVHKKRENTALVDINKVYERRPCVGWLALLIPQLLTQNLNPKISLFLNLWELCKTGIKMMKLLLNNIGKGKLSEKKAFGFKMKKKAQEHNSSIWQSLRSR